MADGPAIQNLTRYRGANWLLRFTVKSGTGAIQNVASWTTKLTLRKTATTPDPVTLQVSGAVVSDGSAGQIDVTVTKTQSLALQARDYVYSFERTNAGAEDVLTIGTITVAYDILTAKSTGA
jgi:hypothetical protein